MPARLLAVCLLVLAGASRPSAQSTTYSWDFDTGLQGWTVTGLWGADNTPSAGVNVAPVPPPPGGTPIGPAPGIEGQVNFSPPNSLNYNDGADYETFGANAGTATSPPIVLSTVENFGWRCAYETENPTDDTSPAPASTAERMSNCDRRLVRVRNAAGAVVFEQQMLPFGGLNPPTWAPGPLDSVQTCLQMGQWHTHYFPLDPAWSPMRVEFFFTTVDALHNEHTGWFIDDAAVSNSSGGGGPGGWGPGGASRDNANGDGGANDLFCGGSAGASCAALAGLLAMAFLLFPLQSRSGE